MKSSSELIAKQVFLVNAYYTRKQNKTKELFFKCLDENKSYEYFQKELSKIWDDIDHQWMDKQIKKLQKLVHSNNVDEYLNLNRFNEDLVQFTNVKIDDWVINDEYFKLTPETDFIKFEQKFKKNVENNYKRSKDAITKQNKDTYINKKLSTYNKQINQTITYFDKEGVGIRQIQLSSYLSMIHNTNLTRSGWNQTMSDSESLNRTSFIIPYHSFSCPYCLVHQNRILSKREVENLIGDTEERQGDILHPNCKCTLSIYWDESQKDKLMYSEAEAKELYKLRQKVNRLTLEKSNLATDRRIAKELGDEAMVDKCRQRINAINRTLRDIKADLPNEELQIQITAINR